MTTGMEYVIALESTILKALHGKIGDKGLRADAQAMLTKSWHGPGTRLAALQDIAGRLK